MRPTAGAHTCVAALVGLAVQAGTATAQPEGAQGYPSRPVRMVLGSPPGGGTDIVTRTLAQKLSESWGQPVVAENRPGANGMIATDFVAKARPDGYTLLVAIATHAINPTLYPKIPYDTARDFAPITLLAQYPFLLVVHPSLPVRNVRELIALARSRPGQLAYASSGNGSGPHLGFELFRSTAGIDLVHVPYKGAGPATTELVAGQVQVMFNNFLAGLPMIRAGRLRPLAVTGLRRSRAMPEVPTMAESGVPGFDVTGWYALLAPTGTPGAIVGKVQADAARALKLPDVHERLSGEGAETVGNTPAEFSAYLRDELVKWAKVVRAAGVRGD